jgi:uncharacterized damage-inducible protein DinB
MTSFLPAALDTYRKQKQMAERATAQVSDEDLHVPLHSETNSIAVIAKHMAGNMRSRWTDFLTSDGEKPWRNRDSEFVDTYQSRAEMLADWESGWSCLFQGVGSLTEADLAREITIRGEPHAVPLAILRQIDHYAYHTGQIVMIARILAKGDWQVLTIPRGQSEQFNARHWQGRKP